MGLCVHVVGACSMCVCVCPHILVCVCGAESALGTPCCWESTGRGQAVSTHSGPTRPAHRPPSSSGHISFRTPALNEPRAPGGSGSEAQVLGQSSRSTPVPVRKQPGGHKPPSPRATTGSFSLGMPARSHLLSSIIRMGRNPWGRTAPEGGTPEAHPHWDPRVWRESRGGGGSRAAPVVTGAHPGGAQGHGSSASSPLFPGRSLFLQRLPVRGPHLTG